MSRRRTVEDWRRAVYRTHRVGGAVQVLLLRLADHMRQDRSVSVPRSQLAKELGVHEQRIAERIKAAVDAGFLSRKSGGYRGVTATYEGLFPSECVPLSSTQSKAERVRATSTHSVGEIGTHSMWECVLESGTPLVERTSRRAPTDRDDGSEDETEATQVRFPLTGCMWHEHFCPDDCAKTPESREASA